MTYENTTNLLRLDLQHFAEPGEQEQSPIPKPTPEPTPEPNEPEKTITQAELDEIIEKRIARERAKYADYDDLKAKAEEFEAERKRIEDEKLSEAELLQKQLEEANASKEEVAKQLEQMKEEVEKQRIVAAFKSKASEAGIKYTDAAVKLSDLGGLEVDEDGELVGIDDVLNALITENPFLVEVEEKKPRHIGGGTNAGDGNEEKTKEQLLEEARVKAIQSGQPRDRAAYAKLKRELNK